MGSTRTRRQSLDPLLGNENWNSRHCDRGCHLQSGARPLPQPKIPPREYDLGLFLQEPVQLKCRGVYSGRRVWIILGLGLFVLSTSSSSSSSWSLSHTWTTTLGVVSVAACSSYFSPRERNALLGDLGGSREPPGGGARGRPGSAGLAAAWTVGTEGHGRTRSGFLCLWWKEQEAGSPPAPALGALSTGKALLS